MSGATPLLLLCLHCILQGDSDLWIFPDFHPTLQKANFTIMHKIFFEDLTRLQMFQKLEFRKIVMCQWLEHKNHSFIPTLATKIS